MIAVDTSSFVAYLKGDKGDDVEEVERALEMKQMVFPPVVLTEIISDPKLDSRVINLLLQVPTLPVSEGYWERAGKARSKILGRGNKARVADALIAQVCIDSDVPLLTRDKDFNHFRTMCGLKLFLKDR
jgi:predicted nucleic acid-binding protein